MKKPLWLMAAFGAMVGVGLVVLYLASDSDDLFVQTARVGQAEVIVTSDCGFSGGECSYKAGVRPLNDEPIGFLWQSHEVNDEPTIFASANDQFIAIQVERWNHQKNQKIGNFWCASYDMKLRKSAFGVNAGLRPFSAQTQTRLRRFGGAEARELDIHHLGRWKWQDRDYKNFIALANEPSD